jgi:fibronectin type 3 domain-containing protein
VSSAAGKPASFKIYRGSSASNLSLHQAGIETEIFIDAALPANGTYWYAVTAVDGNGKESARSNAMEVKT